MTDKWAQLEASSPTLESYEDGKAEQWEKFGCKSPYILRGLITQVGYFNAGFRPTSKSAVKLADYFSQDRCDAALTLSKAELSIIKSFQDKPAGGAH